MYTRPDGGISIVVPAPKSDLEKVLGPISQETYEAHVWERSVPSDAINPRYVDEGGVPEDRKFRGAWVDATPEASVDIDLALAKDVALNDLRNKRKDLMVKLDIEFMTKLEKGEDLTDVKLRKQQLRDITNPLKELVVEGYNDSEKLALIDSLSNIPE